MANEFSNRWQAVDARLQATFALLVRDLLPTSSDSSIKLAEPPVWLDRLLSSVCALQGHMNDISADAREAFYSQEKFSSALNAVHAELSRVENAFTRLRAGTLPRHLRENPLVGTHSNLHPSPSLPQEGMDRCDDCTDRRLLVHTSVQIRNMVVSLQVYLALLELTDPPHSTKHACKHSAMQRGIRPHVSPAFMTQNCT